MITWTWKRTLRTESSERFLASSAGMDVAAVDLHYLPSGHVSGTVIILDDSSITDDDAGLLLESLDDDMLPGVDIQEGTATFTVVRGRVIGSFESKSQ